MLSTSFASLVAALLLVVNGVYTTPIDLVKRASCNKESFMMFRMYAAPVDDPTGERWPVKLIDVKTPSTSIDKLQALTVSWIVLHNIETKCDVGMPIRFVWPGPCLLGVK